MGVFSKIGEADHAGGGIYLLDGNYVLQIEELKSGRSRKDIDFFVAECRVLQSTNPQRKPGTIVSYWVGLIKDTPGLADVRYFLSVAGECSLEEVDEAAAEMACSPEQPFKGVVLRCAATTIKTEKKKSDFTKTVWSLFEGSEGDVAALRKACGL